MKALTTRLMEVVPVESLKELEPALGKERTSVIVSEAGSLRAASATDSVVKHHKQLKSSQERHCQLTSWGGSMPRRFGGDSLSIYRKHETTSKPRRQQGACC